MTNGSLFQKSLECRFHSGRLFARFIWQCGCDIRVKPTQLTLTPLNCRFCSIRAIWRGSWVDPQHNNSRFKGITGGNQGEKAWHKCYCELKNVWHNCHCAEILVHLQLGQHFGAIDWVMLQCNGWGSPVGCYASQILSLLLLKLRKSTL